MGQALYRKYRSRMLDEIVGQEHITTTLSNALKKGMISHAYLFTGPRGVGKTSIARILAHEVNGLPYDQEASHLDIIEIDAASNRRIEEIRDLRDKVHTAPTSSQYKVYIIDEVHMLTKEAFNALLKTLEEPPAHVIFILATTEIHKVPETIISRTQRFTFKPIEPAKALSHLRHIAKTEKITISDEALMLIAEHGGGSFRDSISLLDQISGVRQDKIETVDVEAMLGLAPHSAIKQLLTLLVANASPKDIHAYVRQLSEQGIAATQIAKQLQSLIKHQLVNGELAMELEEATALMRKLLAVSASANSDDALLIALLESIKPGQPAVKTPAPKLVEQVVVTEEVVIQQQAPLPAEPPAKKAVAPAKTKDSAPLSSGVDFWDETLATVKQSYNTLYGILRMAHPELSDQTLTLKFTFPFHQKRINETQNRQLLSDIIQRQTGQIYELICIVEKTGSKKPRALSKKPETNKTLQTISDIFGDAEVIE